MQHGHIANNNVNKMYESCIQQFGVTPIILEIQKDCKVENGCLEIHVEFLVLIDVTSTVAAI